MSVDPDTLPWYADSPEGYGWKCPDCPSWATLGGNAAYHAFKAGHGAPTLQAIPKSELTLRIGVPAAESELRIMVEAAFREGWQAGASSDFDIATSGIVAEMRAEQKDWEGSEAFRLTSGLRRKT